jgi:hypothetical protein
MQLCADGLESTGSTFLPAVTFDFAKWRFVAQIAVPFKVPKTTPDF